MIKEKIRERKKQEHIAKPAFAQNDSEQGEENDFK